MVDSCAALAATGVKSRSPPAGRCPPRSGSGRRGRSTGRTPRCRRRRPATCARTGTPARRPRRRAAAASSAQARHGLDGLRAGHDRGRRSAGRAARRTTCPPGPRPVRPGATSPGRAGPPAPSARRRPAGAGVRAAPRSCGGTSSSAASIIPAGNRRRLDGVAAGAQPAGAHVGRERRGREPLGDLGAGHERPRPARRISRFSSTSPSTARRSVIRATPRSRARSRSAGQRLARDEPGDHPLEACAHVLLLGRARPVLHGGHDIGTAAGGTRRLSR